MGREPQLCGKATWCFSRWQSSSESLRGQPSARCQRERGKKREQTLSVSAILWAKRKHAGPSAGGAEGGPPAPVRGGLPAAVPRWPCPGSLRWGSGGSPSGQRSSFAFGASAEGVRASPGTLCFLRGWG